jgi:phosphoribosylformimino-5-aminoimidazole carboxamide ribotide isomerase
MSLDKVGGNFGPDINRLRDFRNKHPEKNFIAAGGIRNEHDLLRLHEIGIHQVLVASALHSGMLNTEIIERLISI